MGEGEGGTNGKKSIDIHIHTEKAMAPHSSTLAWKIPWTEEPGRLRSMGLLRVGHDWATSFSLFTFMLEKEMATHSRVLAWRIPGTGEPGGLPSMGSHRVGHDWSDLAAAAAEMPLLPVLRYMWHFKNKSPKLFELPPLKWKKENVYVSSLESVLLLFDQENINSSFQNYFSVSWAACS